MKKLCRKPKLRIPKSVNGISNDAPNDACSLKLKVPVLLYVELCARTRAEPKPKSALKLYLVSMPAKEIRLY